MTIPTIRIPDAFAVSSMAGPITTDETVAPGSLAPNQAEDQVTSRAPTLATSRVANSAVAEIALGRSPTRRPSSPMTTIAGIAANTARTHANVAMRKIADGSG